MMRYRAGHAEGASAHGDAQGLPADEVSLHPVRTLVVAARGADVHRTLRPRTDAALVVDDAVRTVLGDEVIGRDALLDPGDERFKRIRLATAGAAIAVAHPGEQEETHL